MTAYEDYQAKLDALKKKKKAQQALLKTSEEQIPLLDLLGDKTKISAETARINVEISKIQKEISRIDSSIADARHIDGVRS
jgi:predicted RNA-binding protein